MLLRPGSWAAEELVPTMSALDAWATRAPRSSKERQAGTTRLRWSRATVTGCARTPASPPPGWNNKTHEYRTLISVAMVAGIPAYGMLTVDALDPGDLAERAARCSR